MCLLALLYRIVEDAPLVIGANREEFYDRPSEPPQILEGPARAVAGVDTLAGGTWLGINDRGMVVAVTNRSKLRVPAQPRSRGLLVRELLGCQSTDNALTLARQELDLGRYAGCNLVCGDADNLMVFQGADWLRINPLPPGLHILTNYELNDVHDPRSTHAWNWLNEQPFSTSDQCLLALKQLCAHTGNGTPAICLHGKKRGTVSSTMIALRPELTKSVYQHAHGPPDQTPYQDFSHLLAEIAL